MYTIKRKSIRSGKVEELTAHSPMLAATYEEAIVEFTELVREWLHNDTSGTVLYQDIPAPGYYDESGNVILLEAGTTDRYNDGHHEYYIEEV